MTEKVGDAFLLCVKDLDAKDAGVTVKPRNVDPGVH
jgi:hypothetical protein